jgi:hypothetical protein
MERWFEAEYVELSAKSFYDYIHDGSKKVVCKEGTVGIKLYSQLALKEVLEKKDK